MDCHGYFTPLSYLYDSFVGIYSSSIWWFCLTFILHHYTFYMDISSCYFHFFMFVVIDCCSSYFLIIFLYFKLCLLCRVIFDQLGKKVYRVISIVEELRQWVACNFINNFLKSKNTCNNQSIAGLRMFYCWEPLDGPDALTNRVTVAFSAVKLDLSN